MFTILLILTIIYAFLKISNMRAEFSRRDAARRAEAEAEAAAAEEAMEEAAEEEEIRNNAIDVEAETIENAVDFDVEEAFEIPVVDVETNKVEVEA